VFKSSLTEIHRVLGVHNGFTEEGLDFIPSAKLRPGPSMELRAGNYDIEYRMGATRSTKRNEPRAACDLLLPRLMNGEIAA
jgi:hypothetical protein